MSHREDNITRLAGRCPDVVAALKGAAGGVLNIEPARSGVPTAKRSGRWIHSAYDPIREAEDWADSHVAACRGGETVVVTGVGLLYHVEALCARLTPDIDVAVVVSSLDEWHDAFAARALGACLDRIEWLLGAPDDIAQALADRGRPVRCLSYGPAAQAEAAFHQAFEDALRRQLARRAGGRLSIALVGPIYGGSLPVAGYVKRALEALGHTVRFIDHSVHAASYQAMRRFSDARHSQVMSSRFADMLGQWTMAMIAEAPPDIVLCMAQAPVSPPVLEHLRKKKFLTAMWFVENYRHLTYWQQVAGAYDYWFVIQREACLDALRRAGAREVSYLPMAADPTIHMPLSLSEEDRACYGADLSFVGAGYPNRRQLFPSLLGKPWSFKLWGNEWDGAENLRSVLQLNGARVDTETCMKIFNASAINLNLHSTAGLDLDPQADFVNPRTFELAACGAFQLVDHRSLLSEFFSDQEIVSFKSFADVPELVSRRLEDPTARQAMADAARAQVLAAHTYEHRMRTLLAHIGVSSPDRVGALLRGERGKAALLRRCADDAPLAALLQAHPSGERVELKDMAEQIRAKGLSRPLTREELMVLLLNEYRSETRDLVA